VLGIYDEADSVDPAVLYRYYGAADSGPDAASLSHDDADQDTESVESTNSSESDDNSSSQSNTGSASASSNSSSESGDESTSESGDDPSSESEDDPSSESEGTSTSVSETDPNSGHARHHSAANDGVSPEVDANSEGGGPGTREAIAKTITDAQQRNVRHDAAEVAISAMPFESTDEMHAYILALEAALSSEEYPAGFGLSEEYESLESYKTGRSIRPLIIPLPYDVWFPRIVVWCKALDLLKRLPLCRAAALE
jgi:hypothetical protein